MLLIVFVVAVTVWVLTNSSPDGHEPGAELDTAVAVWVATHGDDVTTTTRRSDDNGGSWSVVYQEKSALTS